MGSLDPELPDTTLFVTVFFKFSSLYFVFTRIKELQAGISALRGERVNNVG